MARKISAPGKNKQIDNEKTYRSKSTFWQDICNTILKREVVMVIMVAAMLLMFIYPQTMELVCLFAGIVYFGFNIRNRRLQLPIRLPAWTKKVDYGDPKPGRESYNQASGVMFLGNDIDGRELWLKNTDMTTHMLVYGTTGSGKTVTLQSIAYNAFVMGTGLAYIDPKGSPNLAHELFIMARRLSRDDDFLLLDYMTAGKSTEEHTPFRISNTTNPFATAPPDAIINLLTSLLPKDEGGGNAVFQQKAVALLSSLIPVLCALRDAKQSLPLTNMSKVAGFEMEKGGLGSGMSIKTIADYLEPVKIVSLVYPLKEKTKSSNNAWSDQMAKKDKKDGNSGYEIEECREVTKFVPKPLLDNLKTALSSVNYNPLGKAPNEQQTFLDQFGYAKGYFGAPLASLCGMYGHVFNVSNGEIDMQDVLFNRRVLVCILPSLEKSPTECENLGKIILASVKNAVSGGLGTKYEGHTETITGSLPSASKVPGIIIVDEYAAIMMPGFEVILTQARSLGFMAIIASQDYSGMKGKDAKSCDQIVENTKIKMFMTMASAKETWDLAKSLFGEINVEKANLENPEGRGTLEKTNKVSQWDLMSQIEGEFHAFYKGDLIIGSTRYMIPKVESHFNPRINRFIRTDISPEKIFRNVAAMRQQINSRKVEEEDLQWLEDIKKKIVLKNLFQVVEHFD